MSQEKKSSVQPGHFDQKTGLYKTKLPKNIIVTQECSASEHQEHSQSEEWESGGDDDVDIERVDYGYED